MKFRRLGTKGPQVSALGLGCMSISGHYGPGDEASGLKVIQKAFDKGINFFDTADMYGKGKNEVVVGKAIKPFRDKIILATKCALEYIPEGLRINNDPNYIKQACENSLKRLDVKHIDLYYLHRQNPEVPIEESMAAMLELIGDGKIRYVGLSEVGPESIQRAYDVLGDKLVALQSEYSLMNYTAAESVLPKCRELGLAFVAFSPLVRGLISGKIADRNAIVAGGEDDFRNHLPQFKEESLEQNLKLVNALEQFAKQKHITLAQLALAWLLALGDDIIPIPGTKHLHYLEENLAAVDVQLTASDLKHLDDVIQRHPVAGTRMPEHMMSFNWNP